MRRKMKGLDKLLLLTHKSTRIKILRRANLKSNLNHLTVMRAAVVKVAAIVNLKMTPRKEKSNNLSKMIRNNHNRK